MEVSTLTRNLRPLVAHGWVALGPGGDDRSRCVSPTDAGRAKRDEAQREWQRAQLALTTASAMCAWRGYTSCSTNAWP